MVGCIELCILCAEANNGGCRIGNRPCRLSAGSNGKVAVLGRRCMAGNGACDAGAGYRDGASRPVTTGRGSGAVVGCRGDRCLAAACGEGSCDPGWDDACDCAIAPMAAAAAAERGDT